MTQHQKLTAELERLALRAVRRSYDDLNGSLFRWQLEPPAFELVDVESRLGRWNGPVRTIELSPKLLVEHGWGTLVEVLKHEMAHQYVNEVLGVEESDHGPVFRKVCEERGIDARAAGVPTARGEPHQEQILERIQKLLALAESPNEHEAQAAMSAAQRLMLKYNIETVLKGGAHAYGFRHLGAPSGRIHESQRILASILNDFFFVEVIWVPVYRPLEGKRGRVLEVCGTRENLELAEYVHDFLTQTSERLWRKYQERTGSRSSQHRLAFLSGVMFGFRDKLIAERRKNETDGLIWVGDAELHRFFRSRHRHIRWSRSEQKPRNAAHFEGRQAGREIVLHRGIRAGAADGPPRLLGAKS